MILRDLAITLPPFELYRRVSPNHDQSFLLQSAEGPRKLARFSMIGFDPQAHVQLRQGGCTIRDASTTTEPSLAAAIRVLLARYRPQNAQYRYLGGLVGYVGYEYAWDLEALPRRPTASGFYDAEFGLYLDGVVYDHAEEKIVYFSHGADRSAQIESAARTSPPPLRAASAKDARRSPEESQFRRGVESIQSHILEGDIFQAVLSKKIELIVDGDLLSIYAALVERNPSPYMYCLRFGKRAIVGASPEMLVRVQDGRIETFPIAGTRPLTGNASRDDQLSDELSNDPKENSEHEMLVDLARNDVGRVAEFGSVRVTEHRRVERYSHVQHLVSRVEGRLRRDADAVDAFNALFPAGTVSGAPKVRAMEILNALEHDARGPYAGAVGYFSFNGNVDSAITLRSLVVDGEFGTIQSGAGIVADSDPSTEWIETEAKARILASILGVES